MGYVVRVRGTAEHQGRVRVPLAIHWSRHWIGSEPILCCSVLQTKEATSWGDHCVADHENWVPLVLLLGGCMTLHESPSTSLYAFFQRVSGKNKYSHVLQCVQPECFLTLGGPALWLTQNLFVPLLSVSLLSILRGGCQFSSSNLCPSLPASHFPGAFYSGTQEWKGPVPLQGTPDFPSLFHRNASQRPSCTSLLSHWNRSSLGFMILL